MRAPSSSLLAGSARGLAFQLPALVLGPLWFSLLVTGWSVTLGLAVTPLVIPAALGTVLLVRLAAGLEAALARSLLGADAQVPELPKPHGFWRRIWAIVSEPWIWRAQAWLVLRITVGFALAVALISLLAAGLGLLSAPLWYWSVHYGTETGVWRIDSLGRALAAMPLGALALALALVLARAATGPSRALANATLGIGSGPAFGGPGAPGEPSASGGPGARRALAIHAVASAGFASLLILLWALTSLGYFWPVWPMLVLAAALGIHAVVVFVNENRAWLIERRLDRGFGIHAGVWVVLMLFLTGVWGASGGGYFWPVWPLLAGLIAVGINAAALLMTGDRTALTERISTLEESRAGAVDVQEAELRRIERDLHDGAQARLVALGMSLGMAEQKLTSEPEAAAELLADARAGAGEALRELRDLARGIHPPVLADRGLDAAVRALAAASPISVTVSATVPDRPKPPVESAAYFVVAEALANAGKHSGAGRVDVRILSGDGVLSVEVHDDGTGGADPAGGGLSGLRRRVEALDGSLSVISPPGGPTTIRAELPCA
jgi:signal transduction histidine kinase